MEAIDIFKEILKSPELQSDFQISKDEIEQEDFYNQSKYPVIEVIKAIINGQENRSSRDHIFQIIRKQIIE